MKNTPAIGHIRPATKPLRDEAQRGRILDAATQCVVRRGFHATSMGELAKAAGMSVGQIYRYFVGKDAIVQAVVRRIVDRQVQFMHAHSASRSELIREAARGVLHGGTNSGRDDRVLMLEIYAEATRNPAVAAMLHEAEVPLRASAVEMIRRACPELSEAEARRRVELLAILSRGSAGRTLIGLVEDLEGMETLFRSVIGHSLSPH